MAIVAASNEALRTRAWPLALVPRPVDWADPAADPAADVRRAIAAFRSAVGQRPDTLRLGLAAAHTLGRCLATNPACRPASPDGVALPVRFAGLTVVILPTEATDAAYVTREEVA